MLKLPPYSRRRLIGTSAATLIGAPAFAQSVIGGGAPPPAVPGGSSAPISVSGAQTAPIPIAITPFDSQGVGAQITQVITDDLNHSGLFRSIDPASFVPNSITNGTPVWANWTLLGAQGIITGDVSDQGGGQVRVEFRLWSVQSQSQMQGTAYTTTGGNWRRIAHIIADTVYQQVIGDKGYFYSRVAFILESGPQTSPIRRLAVMDYDGANVQFLTDGSSMAISPTYNPTRQQLAFCSFEGSNPRIYTFDLQSGTKRLVGAFGEQTIGPRFSPDGNSLLMSGAGHGCLALGRGGVGGGAPVQLTAYSSINDGPC